MNLFDMMGLVSTLTFLIPIILLFALKLLGYRSFPALAVFYALFLVKNIFIMNYFQVNDSFTANFTFFKNLVETPAILFFLTYFARTPQIRKRLLITIGSYVTFEVIALIIFGFTDKAMLALKGPGLLLVMVYATIFFIHQVKITVVYHKAAGKALMVGGLLFAYVGYAYVYVLNVIIVTPYKNDAYLLYFLVMIFSGISMIVGLIFEQKRVRQLEELRTTREELKAIYGEQEEKTTASFETIVFNYDKKQWN